MFTARCEKPECKNMLVRRRQASPSATSAGTSAPRIKTSRGCCSTPATNGTPALLTPTAATSTYTATQTLMRPNVTGRREIKGRLVDASGAGSHGRGRRLEPWWGVLQGPPEHALEVGAVPAPPVSSPETLKVTSSSATRSILLHP